jgi:hypothetical protein
MYFNLLLRTTEQAIQAFVPVAFVWMWARCQGATKGVRAVRQGLTLGVIVGLLGAHPFHVSAHQAALTAPLAVFIACTAIVFAAFAWQRCIVGRLRNAPTLAVCLMISGATAAIVVRQLVDAGSVLETVAIELRMFGATAAIVSAFGLGCAVSCAWHRVGKRLNPIDLGSAVRTFAVVFVAQTAVYAFHELSEARWLPLSEILHEITEPYGPEGIFGARLSELLVLAPLAAVAAMRSGLWNRIELRRTTMPSRRFVVAALGVISLALIGAQGADSTPHRDRNIVDQREIDAVQAKPYLLFRDLSRTNRFGSLAIAPLEAPDAHRVATSLACDRISFAAGHGLCLRTVPGVFFNYSSVVLDASLRPLTSMPLEGRPSRTRTSPDGRVGAATVFVFGDKYAAQFSTRTTLVDLSTGDVIGELEKFSTWRNGSRFSAVDFNFWGVTFVGDHNTFYASLGTGGTTYLVKGDLALRKFTVMGEGVECPSISPDNRRIAFKKRVGTKPGTWRLAVRDLGTMRDRLVTAETRSIDDQVEWLDSNHILYAVPNPATAVNDIWMTDVDGSAAPKVFLAQAESPIVVR